MKILNKLTAYFETGRPIAVVLSVTLSVLFITGLVQAASTISTNITTDGTITSNYASSTVLSVNNTAYFGGTASTTINVAGLITSPNALVTGSSTLQDFSFRHATSSVTGGTVAITSGNSATSTMTVGCIQTYATSTASPIRISIGIAGAMGPATSTYGAVNTNGTVYWQFGTCPR